MKKRKGYYMGTESENDRGVLRGGKEKERESVKEIEEKDRKQSERNR